MTLDGPHQSWWLKQKGAQGAMSLAVVTSGVIYFIISKTARETKMVLQSAAQPLRLHLLTEPCTSRKIVKIRSVSVMPCCSYQSISDWLHKHFNWFLREGNSCSFLFIVWRESCEIARSLKVHIARWDITCTVSGWMYKYKWIKSFQLAIITWNNARKILYTVLNS